MFNCSMVNPLTGMRRVHRKRGGEGGNLKRGREGGREEERAIRTKKHNAGGPQWPTRDCNTQLVPSDATISFALPTFTSCPAVMGRRTNPADNGTFYISLFVISADLSFRGTMRVPMPRQNLYTKAD